MFFVGGRRKSQIYGSVRFKYRMVPFLRQKFVSTAKVKMLHIWAKTTDFGPKKSNLFLSKCLKLQYCSYFLEIIEVHSFGPRYEQLLDPFKEKNLKWIPFNLRFVTFFYFQPELSTEILNHLCNFRYILLSVLRN